MTSRSAAYGDRLKCELAMFWGEARDAFGRVPQRIAGTFRDQQIPEGTDNPYWEIIRQMPLTPEHYGPVCPTNMFVTTTGVWTLGDQEDISSVYTYSICSPGDVLWFQRVLNGRAVIEIGAGGGYWAWQLRQAGIRVRAYDAAPVGARPINPYASVRWTDVELGDADDASRFPDHALFICWPCPESHGGIWAYDALAQYEGDMFIYAAAEDQCATPEFYALLERDWRLARVAPEHVSWWLVNDVLAVYRRKRPDECVPAQISAALANIR